MGKHSKHNKSRGKGSKGKHGAFNERSIGRIPELPDELFAVIAEHLVGDYAFGTAASLNLASSAIRTETLPVLYETVFLWPDTKAMLSDETNDAKKYTKFLFTGFASVEESSTWEQHFPRLMMAVSYGSPRPFSTIEGSHVHILKPISYMAAILILNTPVRHFSHDHSLCLSKPGFNQRGMPTTNSMKLRAKLPHYCALEDAAPLIRPIVTIGKLSFGNGSPLGRADEMDNMPPDIGNRLHRTTMSTTGCPCCAEIRIAITAVDLLRLCAGADSSALAKEEERLIKDLRDIERGRDIGCLKKARYSPWHLKLELSLGTAREFADMLEQEAAVNPQVLQSRILLRVTGIHEFEDVKSLMNDFCGAYCGYLTSKEHVLPSKTVPAEVFRFETKIKHVKATSRVTMIVGMIASFTATIKNEEVHMWHALKLADEPVEFRRAENGEDVQGSIAPPGGSSSGSEA